jgi:hypothetical protein
VGFGNHVISVWGSVRGVKGWARPGLGVGVDRQPQELVLSAKIRLRNKAAHMITSECGVVRPDVGL